MVDIVDMSDGDFPSPIVADSEDSLHLHFDAWEGSLELLLFLARNQKVDLTHISILELVDQYLEFLNRAQELKIEVAGDYLVMAAWLTWLKSLTLLPAPPNTEPTSEELAQHLRWRLQRLAAMQEAATQLMTSDQIGRDVFRRGNPEGLHRPSKIAWQVNLYTLLAAYGQAKQRTAPTLVTRTLPSISLEAALGYLRHRLRKDWADLRQFMLPAPRAKPSEAETEETAYVHCASLAAAFVAALELTRVGKAELRQQAHLAPLYIRQRAEEKRAGKGAPPRAQNKAQDKAQNRAENRGVRHG